MPGTTLLAAGALAAACALLAVPAAAALYKWTDANGRVVYSDQPPTAANIKAEVLNSPPPPANPSAPKEMAQKDLEIRKRQADRAELAAKSEKERIARSQREQECTRTANAIKQLSWGQVVIYRSNDKGEQVPMDESDRQKERVRLETWLKDNNCGTVQ